MFKKINMLTAANDSGVRVEYDCAGYDDAVICEIGGKEYKMYAVIIEKAKEPPHRWKVLVDVGTAREIKDKKVTIEFLPVELRAEIARYVSEALLVLDMDFEIEDTAPRPPQQQQ